MSLVRVHNFSVSLDGFGTGDGQSLESPFGHAGTRLHEWFFPTRAFRAMGGKQGGSTGIDDAFASNWGPGIGVEIMGRNKFGPQRGPWTDEGWKGWWGEEPPFHTPVFVLTHHVRPSIEMKGGTTFHFIDASPAEALAAAKEAAGGLDVRIGGGPATVRQFLAAGLIDHMHIALVPVLLGRGESLWDGLEGLEERFAIESVSSPSGVTHVTFTRRQPRLGLPPRAGARSGSGRAARPLSAATVVVSSAIMPIRRLCRRCRGGPGHGCARAVTDGMIRGFRFRCSRAIPGAGPGAGSVSGCWISSRGSWVVITADHRRERRPIPRRSRSGRGRSRAAGRRCHGLA